MQNEKRESDQTVIDPDVMSPRVLIVRVAQKMFHESEGQNGD